MSEVFSSTEEPRAFGFLGGRLLVFSKAPDNTRFVEADARVKEPWFWSQAAQVWWGLWARRQSAGLCSGSPRPCPMRMLGSSLRKGSVTGSWPEVGWWGPVPLLGGGIPCGAPRWADPHPAGPCGVVSGVGWPPWQSRPGAQLPSSCWCFLFVSLMLPRSIIYPGNLGFFTCGFGKGFTQILALVVS